jgi:hypothetical protein
VEVHNVKMFAEDLEHRAEPAGLSPMPVHCPRRDKLKADASRALQDIVGLLNAYCPQLTARMIPHPSRPWTRTWRTRLVKRKGPSEHCPASERARVLIRWRIDRPIVK